MLKICLFTIQIIHLLFILFVVVTPFSSCNYFSLMHTFVVPFMVLHWVLNNNTCSLTVFEKYIRKSIYGAVEAAECFTCRLIEPVYDFKNNYNEFSQLIYIITGLLWLINITKLCWKVKTKKITHYKQLFIA